MSSSALNKISEQNQPKNNKNEPFDLEKELLPIQTFFREHTAFELVPDSGKVIVVDVGLTIAQAFHILQENGITSAPLWDCERLDFVGMLTVSDFIDMFTFYDSVRGNQPLNIILSRTTIREWRKTRKMKQKELKKEKLINKGNEMINLPPDTPANIVIGIIFFKR